MLRPLRQLRPLILSISLAAICLHTRGDRTRQPRPATILSSKPHIVLWAWEEPEDLRAVNPQSVGVAFLADRVFLGKQVISVPRRQRILLPQGIWAEAVVRLEPTAGFHDDTATRQAAAEAILKAARLPALRALQVDFDATQSQRAFYADVLRQVRASLPYAERFEITALVSWCSVNQSWLHSLPVDTAVPMEFRLGRHMGEWDAREPLCSRDIGISTDEPSNRPTGASTNRTIYVFSPRPFSRTDLAMLNQGKIPNDAKGAR
jgi:hypothetical protein